MGIKRTRPESPNKAPKIQPSSSLDLEHNVRQRIDLGHAQLVAALKTARGFERQKLGRRRKQAANDKSALARLERETALLKNLDLAAVATNVLVKSLQKVKAIAESEFLPGFAKRLAPVSVEPAWLNVVARLCGSGPVREVVPGFVADLQRVLGVERTKRRAVDSREEHEDEEEFQGFDDDDDDDDDRIAESESEGQEEDLKKRRTDLRALLEPDDQQDDREEDGSSNSDLELPKISLTQRTSRGVSLSPSPSSTDEPDYKRATTSAFLPSLTMGGYISGSDSGDQVDAQAEELAARPRKNKRGQRARRAIWEQKFGDKAKHLHDAGGSAKTKSNRDAGWNAKRGATDGSRDWKNKGAVRGRALASGSGDTARPVPAKKRVKDDQGPLHPSWEAAKRAKAAKDIVTAPFQGKRVTFD